MTNWHMVNVDQQVYDILAAIKESSQSTASMNTAARLAIGLDVVAVDGNQYRIDDPDRPWTEAELDAGVPWQPQK